MVAYADVSWWKECGSQKGYRHHRRTVILNGSRNLQITLTINLGHDRIQLEPSVLANETRAREQYRIHQVAQPLVQAPRLVQLVCDEV